MVFVRNQWPNQAVPCNNCGAPRHRQAKTGLCKDCFWASVADERHWRWKGTEAGSYSIHLRTVKLYPNIGACERCGAPADDRHHIDEDIFNNARSNIEFLCKSCHTKEHHARKGHKGVRAISKVIKYGDVSDVETDFVHAPVGLYHAKAAEVAARNSSNTDEPMVEVRFELTKDADGKKLKKNYANVWYYAPLDPEASWARRLKELVVAYGLKTSGGNLATITGKEVILRLKEDTDQDGEYRPRIAKILKAGAVEAEAEPDEEEEEEELDLDSMSRSELKDLIKEEELEIRVVKSMSDDDIRAAIAEFLTEDEEEEAEEEEEEEEEESEEGEEEAEDEGDNYDTLTAADLRQELEDRELNSKGTKKVMIARLRKDDEEEPV